MTYLSSFVDNDGLLLFLSQLQACTLVFAGVRGGNGKSFDLRDHAVKLTSVNV